MKINFGENLKHLRKEKQYTQEELGVLLGVSFQTISKWERQTTYPDIEMLMKIALLFGTTTDDLLGINNTENEQRVEEYIELFDKMKFENAYDLLEKYESACNEFPNEYRILVRYMEILFKEKDTPWLDVGKRNPEYKNISNKIQSLYEKIQNHCTDDSIRIWSKRIMINHLMKRYCLSYDDKAEKWYCDKESLKAAREIASTMPAMCDTREYLASGVVGRGEIDEWYNCLKDSIEELLFLLQNTISSYCYNDRYTTEDIIEVTTHMNALFEMLISGDKSSKNDLHKIFNYGKLGKLYFEIGDEDKAMENLKICALLSKTFDNKPNKAEAISQYYENDEIFRNMSTCEHIKIMMCEHCNLSEEFKKKTEFKEIIDILEG